MLENKGFKGLQRMSRGSEVRRWNEGLELPENIHFGCENNRFTFQQSAVYAPAGKKGFVV